MTPDIVTQFGQPPYRIDLLNTIDSVSFPEVWKGVVLTNIEGQRVRVIGLTELTKNKMATGRAKDEDDIRRLGARNKRMARRDR